MKINQLVLGITAGILCLSGAAAQAAITYNNTITPTGTGNSAGGWTTSTDNGLALSLRAQYNQYRPAGITDLTPNDGAGTFTFGTGSSTRAIWNVWFDVNPGATSIAGDTFTLTITSSLGGSPVNIPVDLIPDNAHFGTEFQNSENIGFSFIGYDPSLVATYGFTLTARDATGKTLNSVDMTVLNGASPVPEPSTYIAGALLLLPLGASALRKLRKTSAE